MSTGITESKLRQIIRESLLLTEALSAEEAELSIMKRVGKLAKGVIWEMKNAGKFFDLDDEQVSWVEEIGPSLISVAVIVRIDRGVSRDLPEDKIGIVRNWLYNNIFSHVAKREIESAVANGLITHAKLPPERRVFNPTIFRYNALLNNMTLFWDVRLFRLVRVLGQPEAHTIIENYYQMLDFVQPPGKRDINRVSSLKELYDLVEDARPRYQEKAGARRDDPEAVAEGTRVLRDDSDWWIGTIHNCSAAHAHAKCHSGGSLTDWCTAAPGAGCKMFMNYYREDDPLIIFKDRKNDTCYQFSFSANQFMDPYDVKVRPEIKRHLIGLLASLKNRIDPNFTYIHDGISREFYVP